ncbi:MAG: flagellar hook protein FlgE [Chloroflexi bacterium]|nr:flagellar hook protein FlgE [Chloroflexota bacterium]
MSFGIALSGINAAQSDLAVTANNVANSQTTGFKQARSEFAELFAVSPQGVSRTQTGHGVKLAAVAQQFSQGNIEATSNNLDLAISGQGFFVLSDSGALIYTRAGAFQTDSNGYIVNTEGQRLQVYPVTDSGSFNTAMLSDLRLVTSDSAPAATSQAEVVYNLPANVAPPTTGTFDPADSSSYNYATSLTLYDSLGAAHTGSVYFVKNATANSWDSHLYVDGVAVGAAQTLTYSASGALTSPANGQVAYGTYTPTTGANPMALTFDFGRSTQFGQGFGVTNITQDGYTTGKLIGISIDSTGVVQARYTNGRSLALGQVAIANFANPQGLQSIGNTDWAETFASGQALNGQAGNSGFGLIQSGSLEQSNVDITAQLVKMIVAQRNFQANAQMISTEDQITQTIINMR